MPAAAAAAAAVDERESLFGGDKASSSSSRSHQPQRRLYAAACLLGCVGVALLASDGDGDRGGGAAVGDGGELQLGPPPPPPALVADAASEAGMAAAAGAPRARVDHILFACSDLDAGSAWLEAATGVRPMFGGVHTGRGTHNALISLGSFPAGTLVAGAPSSYMEIIAPDPRQPEVPPDPARFDFSFARNGRGCRLANWASSSDDILTLQRLATADGGAGYWPLQVPIPHSSQRVTPDGETLIWSTASPLHGVSSEGGVLPFLIDWEGVIPSGRHPSATSPAGCRLQQLTLRHPNPSLIASALTRIGYVLPSEITVEETESASDAPSIQLSLDTPLRGVVELGQVDFDA